MAYIEQTNSASVISPSPSLSRRRKTSCAVKSAGMLRRSKNSAMTSLSCSPCSISSTLMAPLLSLSRAKTSSFSFSSMPNFISVSCRLMSLSSCFAACMVESTITPMMTFMMPNVVNTTNMNMKISMCGWRSYNGRPTSENSVRRERQNRVYIERDTDPKYTWLLNSFIIWSCCISSSSRECRPYISSPWEPTMLTQSKEQAYRRISSRTPTHIMVLNASTIPWRIRVISLNMRISFTKRNNRHRRSIRRTETRSKFESVLPERPTDRSATDVMTMPKSNTFHLSVKYRHPSTYSRNISSTINTTQTTTSTVMKNWSLDSVSSRRCFTSISTPINTAFAMIVA
mmetsp:Transcript_32440/g.84225  ORF Transcript_32440/g.84225 Transcript_32440/m.84225 type:complete len:343 (+) Transcript_32440:358-1386(+)